MCLDLIDVPFRTRRFVELNLMLVGLGGHIDMHICVDYGIIDVIMFGIRVILICGESWLCGYFGGGWDILLWLFLVVAGILGGDTAHVFKLIIDTAHVFKLIII